MREGRSKRARQSESKIVGERENINVCVCVCEREREGYGGLRQLNTDMKSG